MKLDTRARAVARELVDGEEVVAVVGLSTTFGGAGVHSDGTSRQASTVYSTTYARERGIDQANRSVRLDLERTWLILTPTRLVFATPGSKRLRPVPKAVVEAIPRDGVSLTWFDAGPRALHFVFPDGRQLLVATQYRVPLRRAPFNDEPDLLVEAFGDAATQHQV